MLELAGEWTFDSFSEHLGTLDTFPDYTPEQPVYRSYRRWGLESAALDLALRQAGTSLHAILGREPQPVTFVVSSRMGNPPTLDPVTRRLARYPNIRFKLDGTPDWTDELIDGLVKSGAVDSIDFKGAYKGTVVDVETDPAFYRRIAETFPDAWLEDPDLDDEDAMRALAPFQDRITWDAPIHSVDDILSRKVIPRDGEPQAVAVRLGEGALHRLRVLRAARDGRLRRRPVRARRGPRARPAAGGDLPSARPERHRARRLRRPRPGAGAARNRRWTSIRHPSGSAGT